jgi:hypothetical protein
MTHTSTNTNHSCSFSGESPDELFNNLIECYSRIGFTDSCSALWAHWGTTNEALCSGACITEAQEHDGIDSVGAEEISMIPSNGAPPFCFLSECHSCSFELLEEDFDTLAGIWKSPRNAGMLDNIAYDCHSFYPIENHDPCQGMAVAMLAITNENEPPLVLTIDSASAPSPRPSSRLSVGSSFRTIDIPSISPAGVHQQRRNTLAPVPTPLVLTIDFASAPSATPISRLSVGSIFRTIDGPSISPAEVHGQQSNTPAPIQTPLVLTTDFPDKPPDEVHQQQSNTLAPTPPLVLTVDFPDESPAEVYQQQSSTPAPTPPLVLTTDFPMMATGAAASASASSSQSSALDLSSGPGDSEFSRASMATFYPLLALGIIATSVIFLA